MNPLLKKILAAGRLVRGGRVVEATAAIQHALAAHAAHAAQAAPAPQSAALATTVVDEQTTEPTWIDVEALTAAEPDVVEHGRVAPPPADDRSRRSRFETSSFTCAAGTRAFKLHEPSATEGGRRPLVVMLHGCTQSPDDFAAGTRMNELADRAGAYVLYPEQAPRSNAHKCWNWFVPADQRRGAGEPALLAGMTRHVMQTHPIDPDRVFVAGLSAGGAMAAILAREYADLFAAVGVHSGLAAGAAHDVASAFTVMKAGPGAAGRLVWPGLEPVAAAPRAAAVSVPTIVFHGDADATVAAANGDAVIAAAVAAGDRLERRDSEVRGDAHTKGYRRSLWSRADAPADAPAVLEHWLVHGAPHAWSGGAAAGSYTDPAGPDASREMLRFFLEHPRRHAAP